MLRLSVFITCRKRYYNQKGGGYISALEHCRKMKFRTYLHLTLENTIFYVVTVSDFVVLVQVFMFGVVGSISKV